MANFVAILAKAENISEWDISGDDIFKIVDGTRVNIDNDTVAFQVYTWNGNPCGVFSNLAKRHGYGIHVEVSDDGYAGLQGTWEFGPSGDLIADTTTTGNCGNSELYNRVWTANGHDPNGYL